MPPIIQADNLVKVYKKYKREEGLLSAFKSLVHRKYEEKKAVKGVSFEVEEGEVLGYLGPNGAGKSTTIKMLIGIQHPTSGTANCMGYVPWKQRQDYVKNIGVVLGQKPQLWWDLPPVDSYSFNREMYEIPKKEFKERLDYLVNTLGLTDISKTPLRNLSLGERMRCEVIGALLHNPKIVFLDEPTIGMDVIAKDIIRDFIRKYNKEYGTTFLLTTHDMGDIEELCKRIIIIDNGAIVYDGLLSKIKDLYAKTKVLKFKFGESIEKKRLELHDSEVLNRSKYAIDLRVNTKRIKPSTIISDFMKKYDVEDLSIDEPKVETIIKQIYGMKKDES